MGKKDSGPEKDTSVKTAQPSTYRKKILNKHIYAQDWGLNCTKNSENSVIRKQTK